ncbi:MAG: hypothetical protein L0215_00345 [Gemmataceae bacterium]|nr:hypothetical protein [Gemmataceae bacterium]
METIVIQGTPCPLCGENAFALETFPAAPPFASEYECLWDNDEARVSAHWHARSCTSCGHLQVLLAK